MNVEGVWAQPWATYRPAINSKLIRNTVRSFKYIQLYCFNAVKENPDVH